MASSLSLKNGAQLDSPDNRDYILSFASASPSPVDWDAGSGLQRPPLANQGRTDACVSFACSYFHWQLRGKEFSRHDLFARIASPIIGNGAEIRDGMLEIVNKGQALETDFPDPNPITDTKMRDKTGLVDADELPWKEYSAFKCKQTDIDTIARAILTYRGVVIGVYYTNAGWAQNWTVPEPPLASQLQNIDGDVVFKHALYLVDFHMHTNTDGSIEKCLVASTSWPINGVTEHHIRERYFRANATFCPWTFVPSSAVASVVQNVTLSVTGDLAAAAGQAPQRVRKPARKNPTKSGSAKKANSKSAAKKKAAKSRLKESGVKRPQRK